MASGPSIDKPILVGVSLRKEIQSSDRNIPFDCSENLVCAGAAARNCASARLYQSTGTTVGSPACQMMVGAASGEILENILSRIAATTSALMTVRSSRFLR